MYYCNDCGNKLDWPTTDIILDKHFGICEICGTPDCNCNKEHLKKLDLVKYKFEDIKLYVEDNKDANKSRDPDLRSRKIDGTS